jgi:hypothetical protein
MSKRARLSLLGMETRGLVFSMVLLAAGCTLDVNKLRGWGADAADVAVYPDSGSERTVVPEAAASVDGPTDVNCLGEAGGETWVDAGGSEVSTGIDTGGASTADAPLVQGCGSGREGSTDCDAPADAASSTEGGTQTGGVIGSGGGVGTGGGPGSGGAGGAGGISGSGGATGIDSGSLGNGSACSASSQCQSGFCVGNPGQCCSQDCKNSCYQPDRCLNGACVPVADALTCGTDTGGVIGTGGATGTDGPSTDGAINTGDAGTGGSSGTGGVATGGGTGSGGIPGSGGSAIDGGGAINHAVELAGSQSSYLDVGNVPIPADFTLEVWTRVAASQSSGTDHMMIVKDTSFVSQNQFRVFLRNGYLMFMMSDPTGQDGGLFAGMTSAVRTAEPVATEVWLHLAITKAGTSFVLYLNGSPQTRFTTAVNLSHAGNVTMRFGGRNGTDNTWFRGAVDEVRLWNVARSASDIQADMARSIASSRADFTSLVAYWKLDEGTGALTADARSTFDGVLSSVSWLTPGAPLQY